MKNSLIKIFTLTLCFGIFSCEEDFLNIDSDVNGAQNFKITTKEFPVTAYSKATGPVQANALPTNYLGVLVDENYSNTQTVSNFIAEIVPTTFNPDFGENPIIKSVGIYIPYFSTLIATDANGDSTYELLGHLGNIDDTFKLSILKSNYLLRDLDPSTNFEEQQIYHTDFYSTTLEAQDDAYTVLYSKDDYKISEAEVKVFALDGSGDPIDSETVRLAPGFRQELFYEEATSNSPLVDNKAFWNDLIGIEDDGSGGTTQVTRDYLTNANTFKEFFRGLIIKIEATSGVNTGSSIVLNLDNNSAGITIDYINDEELAPDYEPDIRTPSIYNLGFNGIRVNTHTNSSTINIPGGNTLAGDDNLYLRGFEGSFTVVDLFGTEDLNGNGISDSFEEFKTNKGKWILNEANLTFKVDNSLAIEEQPNRVILYDLKNKQPLVDYFFDQTSNTDSELSRIKFSEPLTRASNGDGIQYKLRLTEHLTNLLVRDSTNVKLGLFVTNDINDQGFIKLKNPITLGSGPNETIVDEIPQQSVVSNKGTILYGTSSSVPVAEKVKFEIYYTEEN